MRVLRVGGDYLAGREARLRTRLALGLTLAGTALVAAVVTARPAGRVFFLLVGIAAIALALNVSTRLQNVQKGRLGEEIVAGLLGRLPDEYFLINDVELRGIRGNADHVLVGPCGVVVIETKRIAGEIRCHRDYWYVDGHRVRSMSRQVRANAVAVRRFLGRRLPDLRGLGLVEAVLVFTHPRCRLSVERAQVTVARFSELLPLVAALADKHGVPLALAERVARSLARP
jgi:hypothetical protein